MVYLPEIVVQRIAAQLMDQSDSQAALLSVMAMCGVSQQWRDVAQRLQGGELHFDSMEGCSRNALGRPLTPTEAAFRKASPTAKGRFFQAAARLLSGYTRCVFAGEGVTDAALVEAGRKVGPNLTSLTVKVWATPARIDAEQIRRGRALSALNGDRARRMLAPSLTPASRPW
jgi:hypothetical protein